MKKHEEIELIKSCDWKERIRQKWSMIAQFLILSNLIHGMPFNKHGSECGGGRWCGQFGNTQEESFNTAVPNLTGTRNWFHGRHFFHRQAGEGNGFGMTQFIIFIGHFISIIITLWSIMKELYRSPECRISGNSELVFLQLDGSIWGWWETVIPEVCCWCPVYSVISFFLLLLQGKKYKRNKNLLHKDRMLETEANISVIFCQSG